MTSYHPPPLLRLLRRIPTTKLWHVLPKPGQHICLDEGAFINFERLNTRNVPVLLLSRQTVFSTLLRRGQGKPFFDHPHYSARPQILRPGKVEDIERRA